MLNIVHEVEHLVDAWQWAQIMVCGELWRVRASSVVAIELEHDCSIHIPLPSSQIAGLSERLSALPYPSRVGAIPNTATFRYLGISWHRTTNF